MISAASFNYYQECVSEAFDIYLLADKEKDPEKQLVLLALSWAMIDPVPYEVLSFN